LSWDEAQHHQLYEWAVTQHAGNAFFFFFGGTVAGTQGFELAKQVLYCK
jgi:hypothetical protein